MRELIEKISLIHPARTMDFKTLYEGLEKELAENFVSVTVHPQYKNLRLYKYNRNCVIDSHWNLFTMIARGLIIDIEAQRVVCSPFVKFFNYNELKDSVTFSEQFTISEKMDGSLGVIWMFDNKWRVSTPGSFVSEQAQWAENYLNEKIDMSCCNIEDTLLSEIIYPENKIVVSYDFSGLVLLSGIFSDGREYSRELSDALALKSGFRRPQFYEFSSLKEIVEVAVSLGANKEGFVIQFKDTSVRVKIKGEEYIRLHRAICHVTPLAIWELLVCGDNVLMVRSELPEELHKDFDTIRSILLKSYNRVLNCIERLYQETKHMTDKELGLFLQTKPKFDGYAYNVYRYIFSYRKGTFYKDLEKTNSLTKRSIYNLFRPDFNKLEGYIPSSVMNRFADNDDV
jgi:RNA ligase